MAVLHWRMHQWQTFSMSTALGATGKAGSGKRDGNGNGSGSGTGAIPNN